MNTYSNITNFEKTPRNILKSDAKLFLKNNGKKGMYILSSFLGGIALSIITLILYFFSICSLLIPIAFILLTVISYGLLILMDPKIEKLNKYPLVMGYVLLANRDLFQKSLQTQGGALIIFTKEKELKLNSELITSIGKKIENKEIENIDSLYKEINNFQKGKSVFSIDIKEPIDGVRIYCSYVILDGRNLPDNKIPENRLIPCLIDEKNRGIAVPYKFIK